MKFQIEDMTCGGCARSVTQAIKNIDSTAELDIDVPARLVEIRSQKSAEELQTVLTAAGFQPRLVNS